MEPVLASRRFASNYQISEKYSKVQDFSIRSKHAKDSNLMASSQTNKQLEYKSSNKKRGINPAMLSISQPEPYFPLNVKKNTASTPSSYSFQKFDPGKIILSSQRPISVGGSNIRPNFLEPEASGIHYSNKSAVLNSSAFLSEGFKDPYKFPLFRAKMIKGFRLSISPEISENEMSLGNIVTSNATLGKITGSHRISASLSRKKRKINDLEKTFQNETSQRRMRKY